MNARITERATLLLRSAGVGAAATVVDLTLLAVLVSGLAVHPRAASVPALAAGVAVQFVGNKRFAFRDRSPNWLRQLTPFIGVEVIALLCNLLVFDLAVTGLPLPYLVTRLLTTSIVYFAVCLPLWSRIFRLEPLLEGRS